MNKSIMNHNVPPEIIDWVEYSQKLEWEHAELWQDKPISYWIARLVQEVGEAASASVGDHDDPLEWEVMQIRAICGNLLRKLQHDRLAEMYPDN